MIADATSEPNDPRGPAATDSHVAAASSALAARIAALDAAWAASRRLPE